MQFLSILPKDTFEYRSLLNRRTNKKFLAVAELSGFLNVSGGDQGDISDDDLVCSRTAQQLAF